MQEKDNICFIYNIFIRRLKKLREDCGKKEIIPFPRIFERLCLLFSINKEECWNILFSLRDTGFIQIVPYHGIKIISKNEN